MTISATSRPAARKATAASVAAATRQEPAPVVSAPTRYRFALVAGIVIAATVAALATNDSVGTTSDASFVRLMRSMAVIKAVLVAAAAAVLWWRFARPLTTAFATGYLLGASLMVAATTLIWNVSTIGLAAIAFHSGEMLLLVLAWRDTRKQ